ncbi:glycoside hydrolase family 65 protein [Microbacterium aerolatum]|uniref:Glycosyl hydrolase n=1 Tax=Microbacterium aerolatum TaxID=153731 RepID=A0A511AD37_9MICO|nr:glycosyl hydrolase family 65 protein [Microbacterium aerolatum]GEK86085.1 glycosyl hydrolase [Microbacterium aerolatum]GGB27014.1 glycosyl hydrolase [Microbacterium aerolatum]
MSGAQFDADPWTVGVRGLNIEHLAQEESVFGLSNGHIGWRGNLDEGDPRGVAGSYLNGVFEEHPMPYAEEGYGYPEKGQAVINVANGQIMRLLVDDEAFDVGHGEMNEHTRTLDLRDGALTRSVRWTSPAGRSVHIESSRIVSFSHRSVAAIRYRVHAIDEPVTITLLSEILANEPLPITHDDPRVQELLAAPWTSVDAAVLGTMATVSHRTKASGILAAVSMDHIVAASGTGEPQIRTEAGDDLARTTITVTLERGEHLEVVKMVGHEWSDTLGASTLRDRAETAVADALRVGWVRLLGMQRERLAEYWACADVQLEGALRLQQAVRFALFQVFQASVRAERRSVPGKGLTGAGYEGHTFWDFEAFVLPVLTATSPDAAKEALRWRHSTLEHARERARQLHLKGAAFAWRTIDGRESSGYWPASTAAFHVNSAVAGAVIHYVRMTGDEPFEREAGVEILVETARLWTSLGRWDELGKFHIDGVTGPDEYSAIADDNLYTNVMAGMNLRGAAAAARRHADIASSLGVTDAETTAWDDAAAAMTVPYNQRRGVHSQSVGYTDHARWDFEHTGSEDYPLQDHFPYFDLYRKQVVKQADLVLALYFAPDMFSLPEKAAAFRYYEAITVRDSSLSSTPQAVIAAEVGHLGLASDYLAESAMIDLDDLHDNTEQGLHIAALAGVWTALTAGFGGLRDSEEGLRFRPRLPPQVPSMSFGLQVRGQTLRLTITPARTTYLLRGERPLTVRHFDEELSLEPGRPVVVDTPPSADPGPPPQQPVGRTPRRFEDVLAIVEEGG